MFNKNKIYTNDSKTRFFCDCTCDSEKKAQYFESSFSGPLKMISYASSLYAHGSTLILNAPDKRTALNLIFYLNNSISKMH